STYTRNPYVSVFRAQGGRNFMSVGFLFQGDEGDKQPAVPIDRRRDDVYRAVNNHLAKIEKTPFFRWEKETSKPIFAFRYPPDARYDVFFSYNRKDVDVVRSIELDLRKEGLACWFDQASLAGGDVWIDKIEQTVTDGRVRAMA